MTFAGNWLFDTFNHPLVYTGHEATSRPTCIR